jgi:hypothetical protein
MTSRFSLLLSASLFLLLLGSSAGEAAHQQPNNVTASCAAHQVSTSLSNITRLASVSTLYTKCEPGALASLTSHTDTGTIISAIITPSPYAGRHVRPPLTTPLSQTSADNASGLSTFASRLLLAIDITLGIVGIKMLVQEVWIDYTGRSYWLAFYGVLELIDKCDKTFQKIASFRTEIQNANTVDPQESCRCCLRDADASISACAAPPLLAASLVVSPTVTPDQGSGNVSFVIQKRPSSLP